MLFALNLLLIPLNYLKTFNLRSFSYSSVTSKCRNCKSFDLIFGNLKAEFQRFSVAVIP